MSDVLEKLRRWVDEGRYRGNHDLHDVLKRAADEIERLRGAENDAAEWVDERTKRLRADNERLRAALREIVEYAQKFGIRDEGDGYALVSIARDALARELEEI